MATSVCQRARRKRHQGAAHRRTTRLRIRCKADHGNQRRMEDIWTDADEHERKREGRIEFEAEGMRQGAEGIERTGPPRVVGRSRTIDAMLGGSTDGGTQMLGGSCCRHC